MKNKKRYFKQWVESFLMMLVGFGIGFIAMTIDSLGNPSYDKTLIIIMIIILLSIKLLNKYSKTFNQDNNK